MHAEQAITNTDHILIHMKKYQLKNLFPTIKITFLTILRLFPRFKITSKSSLVS